MKRVKLFVISILTLVACNKTELVEPNCSYMTNESTKYYQVGVEHNKGLEYVYNQLQNTNQIDFYKESKKYTMSFLKESENENIKNGLEIAKSEAENTFELYDNSALEKSNVNIEHLWTKSVENKLTDLQKELLIELENSIDENDVSGNNDLQAVLDKCAELRERVDNECSSEEKEVMYIALEIAENSLSYWHDNGNEWAKMITNGNPSGGNSEGSFIEIQWGNAGKADIAFGVGGALGGAIAGSIVGGIGAGPGALSGAIGGAISGSVGSVVLDILNSW